VGQVLLGVGTGVQVGGERREGEILRDVHARQHRGRIVKPGRVWLPAAVRHHDKAGIVRSDACKGGVPAAILRSTREGAALARLVKVCQAVFVGVPIVAEVTVRNGRGLQDHPIPALACEVGTAHVVGPPARQVAAGVSVGLRG
jgi:hypothetical protein